MLVVDRFNRECSKDYHYQNITIPAASHVVVPNFLIQRDPKYWVEPERFDPLRYYQFLKIIHNGAVQMLHSFFRVG